METIIKRGRSAEYTIIANSALQDTNLSWKAKGMLAYIMSLPSDWKLSMADLAKRSTDGKSATRSAFNELIEAGYATREQQKVDGRFAGVIYTVTDKPNTDTSEPYSTFPHTEKPNTEKPHTENRTLQRNNIQRNNIQTNNNKENESENEFSQSFPSFNQNENSFISDVYGNPTFDGEVNQSTLNTSNTPDPQCSAAPPTPDAATQREKEAETLREFWNATLVSEGFPTVKKLSPQRITKAAQVVREMIKDGVTAEQLFDKIKNSDFLKSGSKSWFNFDWLIQKRARQFDANWKIIMSGKYDNAPAMQKKKETPAHLKIDPEFAIKFLNNDF